MVTDKISAAPARTRYSTVAIILHWLIAGLLIFEVGLGLRMEAAHGAAKFAVFQLHKSIGITILLLVALRLVWRFYRTPPAIAAKGWERALAHAVHILFYVLLFALPISGWIIVSTSRIVVPTLLYGVIPWPHVPGLASAKEAWHAAAEFLHVNLVKLIYALFALHVAGALKHHFLDRDGDIARMAPGTKPGAWADPRLILIGFGVVIAAGLGLQWLPVGRAVTPPSPVVEAPATVAPEPAPAVVADAPPQATVEEEAPIANTTEAVAEAVPSWTISGDSTLHFRTSWSGDAINGGFKGFDGDIIFSPDHLDRSHVEIRIAMASVFSGDDQRDETLKSADWFAIAAHATAIFKADRFRKLGADRYVANGTLRMKGTSLPISLPFTLKIKGDKAVMQGTAAIDRTAYKVGEGDYASTSEIPAAVNVDVMVHATRK
ncbi:MAG: YceI family protein [Rhizorhabdus sp.]|nr:YceI family protein [Rhizorhabdus sp.]